MQTVDVIFKKPFNAIPTIVCTLKSGSNITTYGDLTAFVDYGSVTKKGFTIKVSNSCATLGAKPCVSWIATVLWNSNLKICDSLYSRGVQNIGNNKTTISISLTSEDQSIFVAFCGTKGSYFISLVRGVYNGELLATNISKSDDCYATAGNLKNTIEIHTGSWGRGILLSYAPFTVSTK